MTETMTDASSKNPHLTFSAAPRGGRTQLVPEEAAAFDLVLKNEAAHPETLLGLEMNDSTPVIRAYDSAGVLLIQGSPSDLSARVIGPLGEVMPKPPRTITLEPGEEQTTWVNLWNYMDPLKPGKFFFEAEHLVPSLHSNRVPFEIVEARVGTCAWGYESAMRMASILAWTAAPAGKPLSLFARLSSFSDHETLQAGASPFGEVPDGSRIAVGQWNGGMSNWQGWIVAVSEGSAGSMAVLYRHAMTVVNWQSEPIALPITNALPVARFPDRGAALVLFTGSQGEKPALAGVAVPPGGPAAIPWSVALSHAVVKSACAFAATGEVTLLLVHEDGKQSQLSRMGFDETGSVITAEATLRTTPNVILAVSADVRHGQPPGFVVVEANRTQHDQLFWYDVPTSGPVGNVPRAVVVKGWPTVPTEAGTRLLPARHFAVERGPRGDLVAAFVDERGRFFGGLLSAGAVHPWPTTGTLTCPHAVSMREKSSFAAFTDRGVLFHAGGH